MPEINIFAVVAKYLWLVIAGFFAWMGKVLWKKNEEFSKIKERIAILEDNQIKEDKVKEIIREILTPYLNDQVEIKNSLKSISENVVRLRINIAEVNAVRGSTNDGKSK